MIIKQSEFGKTETFVYPGFVLDSDTLDSDDLLGGTIYHKGILKNLNKNITIKNKNSNNLILKEVK